MSHAFDLLRLALIDAGYTTHVVDARTPEILSFEDESLMGFGYLFQTPAALLDGWHRIERSVLTQFASQLRNAGEKAWNVYSVFLTAAPAESRLKRQVRWIEENLERTRKIAACGIQTRDDLVRALLPLLPLQFTAILTPETVTERLVVRLRSIAPRAARVLLDPEVPLEDIASMLEEPE